MKKAIKVSLCVITAIIVLSCNVFATWAEETPYFGTEIDMIFANNINSKQSTETLKKCVDNAYQLGLFGGAAPIACVSTPASEYRGVIIICTAPIVEGNVENLKKETEYATFESNTIYPGLGTNTIIYYLLATGDVWGAFGLGDQYNLTENEKILMLKDTNGNWFYDETNPIYAQYENADNSENPGLITINEKYEKVLAEGRTPPPTIYELNIPSIITAVPNAAKQIVNNAFGFEIFGINVAGLLSVILVVTIVAFVVKWLMSR